MREITIQDRLNVTLDRVVTADDLAREGVEPVEGGYYTVTLDKGDRVLNVPCQLRKGVLRANYKDDVYVRESELHNVEVTEMGSES